MKKIIFLILGALACATPPAHAQSGDDEKKCATPNSPELVVLYCTRAITIGQLAGAPLGAALFNRGIAYLAQTDPERAFADLEASVKADPSNPVAFYNLGNLWLGRGNVDRAIAAYSDALRLKPSYEQALGNRGLAWHLKGDLAKAMPDYDAAVRAFPRYVNALYNRGRAWLDLSEPERAIADFDAALKFNPNPKSAPPMLANRGRAWQAKGDAARALADYDAALTIEPTLTEALFNRGVARFITGQYAQAEEDFSQLGLAISAHGALWRHMARTRTGSEAAKSLVQDAMLVTTPEWPAPVLRFYTGELTRAQLLAATANPDANKQAYQRCSSAFYLAEWHLARRETAPARALLLEAQSCGRTTLESMGANAELKRLPP